MNKLFLSILFLAGFNCQAQYSIKGTDPLVYLCATHGISVTDTGQNPNTSKVFSLSLCTNDSAVQTTVANQPRLVNMGFPKAWEFTKANKDMLILLNALKFGLRGSFSINIEFQPFDGIGGTETVFGVVDGDAISIQKNADGRLEFKITSGAATCTLRTADTIFLNDEEFVPKMITAVYDSSVHGVGGLKLYLGTKLLASDATFNGNTSVFSTVSFNPSTLGFGIGARNRTTVDQAFGGRIMSLIIYDRVIDSLEINYIEDLYTDTITESLFGLPNNTINLYLIGPPVQSNGNGDTTLGFPVQYSGIQWGTYQGSITAADVTPLKYTSGIWGFKYKLFKDLANYYGKPVVHLQNAIGGTRLGYNASGADWNVNSTLDSGSSKTINFRLLDKEINSINFTKQWIESRGVHCNIVHALSIQGETDCSTQSYALAYDTNYFELRNWTRDKLADSTLKFTIAQTHNNFVPARAYADTVRQAQFDNSNQSSNPTFYDVNTWIFDTDGYPLKSDKTHYSGVGQWMLSDDFFDILKLFNYGE